MESLAATQTALRKIGEEAPDLLPLTSVVLELAEEMQNGTSSSEDPAQLAQHLSEHHSHPVGLCDDMAGCQPCKASTEAIADKTRRAVFAQLGQSAVWGGIEEAAGAVSAVHERWLTAGGIGAPPLETMAPGVKVGGLSIGRSTITP